MFLKASTIASAMEVARAFCNSGTIVKGKYKITRIALYFTHEISGGDKGPEEISGDSTRARVGVRSREDHVGHGDGEAHFVSNSYPTIKE